MTVLILASCVVLAISAFAQDATTPQSEPTAPAAEKTPYFGRASFAWDTNVKESVMFRVTKPNVRLYSPAYPDGSPTISGFSNVDQDEGDLNFHRGLVMDRTDFLTEMDVGFGDNFGFRASAAAWWNPIYNQRTNYLNSPNGNTTGGGLIPFFFHNNVSGFCNAATNDCGHFAAGTKDQEFLQAELLDAFVHARFFIGNMSLVVKGGQFAQQWGQTLFFGGNGIAGAMAPVDIEKLLMVPNSEFKEIIRPVPQVSMNLQVNPKFSIAAYYQLAWAPDRFPAVGSYFSSGDVSGAGAERFAFPNVIPAQYLPGGNLGGVPGMACGPTGCSPAGAGWLMRYQDRGAKDWGQFGVSTTFAGPHAWDFGLYFVQFHEKAFQFLGNVGGAPAVPYIPKVMGSPDGIIGNYRLVYPQNIQTLGMSASKTVGLINYAAEVSGRRRQDLAIPMNMVPSSGPMAGAYDKNNNSAYPLGDTIHANLSALVTMPRNMLAKESSFAGEVAWNHLVSVTHRADWYPIPAQGVTGNKSTVNALAFMGVYTPTYRQVRPNVDVGVPVGFNYSPWGRSALGIGFAGHQTGFVNIGLSATYAQVNVFTVTFQRFLGAEAGTTDSSGNFTYAQSMGDRNYVAFSIYRKFGVRASQKAR